MSTISHTLYISLPTWTKVYERMIAYDGRRGTFEEDLERCMSRGRGSTRDMCSRDVRRISEVSALMSWEGFHFGASDLQFWEDDLRDRCNTSYALTSLFRGQRGSDSWNGRIAKCIGLRPSAQQSSSHVWRKSCRISSFWMLSSSIIEEVPQNNFLFKLSVR